MSSPVKIPVNKYLSASEIEKKLKTALTQSLNVALIGKHGVGKSSTIIKVLKEANVKFLYFSGATLDPWVDFVGIPTKTIDADGKEYIDYLRPRDLTDPDLEVIIIDEFNRSPKKVRNAVMELIQFKSINGKRFPKLKCVWTGINPSEEGDYDVEDVDPAQFDRFEMHLYVSYQPDMKYFSGKYSDLGSSLCRWWTAQSDAVKEQISPRRLEYVAQAIQSPASSKQLLEDILPKCLSSSEIDTVSKLGSLAGELKTLIDSNNTTGIIKLFEKENTFEKYKSVFLEDLSTFKHVCPVVSKEKLESVKDKMSAKVAAYWTEWLRTSTATNKIDNETIKMVLSYAGIVGLKSTSATDIADYLSDKSIAKRKEIIKKFTDSICALKVEIGNDLEVHSFITRFLASCLILTGKDLHRGLSAYSLRDTVVTNLIGIDITLKISRVPFSQIVKETHLATTTFKSQHMDVLVIRDKLIKSFYTAKVLLQSWNQSISSATVDNFYGGPTNFGNL